MPSTLVKARDDCAASTVDEQTFGKEVEEHYTHAADIELQAFNTVVTDWERVRGFERL